MSKVWCTGWKFGHLLITNYLPLSYKTVTISYIPVKHLVTIQLPLSFLAHSFFYVYFRYKLVAHVCSYSCRSDYFALSLNVFTEFSENRLYLKGIRVDHKRFQIQYPTRCNFFAEFNLPFPTFVFIENIDNFV